MQSNNVFNNLSLGDSNQFIGRISSDNSGTGYKEIFREQMEQAKMNYEKMSESFLQEKISLDQENEFLRDKIMQMNNSYQESSEIFRKS